MENSKESLWKDLSLLSSFGLKFTSVGAGVVDSEHRGNISVVFFDFPNTFYQVEIDDRIAQIVFERISLLVIEEVYEFGDQTERVIGPFGSTRL